MHWGVRSIRRLSSASLGELARHRPCNQLLLGGVLALVDNPTTSCRISHLLRAARGVVRIGIWPRVLSKLRLLL